MALCDYKLCDLCGEKAFYDTGVTDPHYCATWDPSEDVDPIGLAVLCSECAKTHKVGVVPEWQPIETAPTNDQILFTDGNCMWVSTKDIVDAVVADNLSDTPTHWMPLPEPPKEDKHEHV